MVIVFRFALGLIFTVSGFEKALSPSENFLYVIQQYQALPGPLAHLASVVFPWIELFIGIFLILGLWLPVALRLSALMNGTLVLMVGQAILRRLPFGDCGCFGELVHLPLKGVLVLDLAMLAAAIMCLRDLPGTSRCSLDMVYFRKK
jgi:hypothetical protein